MQTRTNQTAHIDSNYQIEDALYDDVILVLLRGNHFKAAENELDEMWLWCGHLFAHICWIRPSSAQLELVFRSHMGLYRLPCEMLQHRIACILTSYWLNNIECYNKSRFYDAFNAGRKRNTADSSSSSISSVCHWIFSRICDFHLDFILSTLPMWDALSRSLTNSILQLLCRFSFL